MKETYNTPELEVVEFEANDIIVTSGVQGDDNPIELPNVSF